MTKIPTPEEIGSGHYFLQALNPPTALLIVRVVIALIAIGFIAAYVYIRVKKDKEN